MSKIRKTGAVFGIELTVLLFLFVVAALYRCSAPPASYTLNSGIYSPGLIMAYDPASSEISGIFQQADSCYFYLVGKLTADKINVVTWHPREKKAERKFGILRMENDNLFRIYLEDVPGFCPSGKPFTVGEGVLFRLVEQKTWHRLRSVKYDNSVVYSNQDTASAKVITLSKFDLVKVIEKNLFWVKVVYGQNDEITGWIKKEDLFRFPG